VRLRALWNTGVPGGENGYAFDWGVVEQLARAVPGSVELDWEEIEDDAPILDALRQITPAAEFDGLDDDRLTLQEWFAAARPKRCRTDLETWLQLLEQLQAPANIRANLYERGDPLIRYRLDQPGAGSCEVALPGRRAVYQREPVDRAKFPLEPLICEPLPGTTRPLAKREAAALVRLSLLALCARNLQIYPLIYPNVRDVRLVPCARGLEVALIGTRPPHRAQLECLYYFGVFKNGVPVAYGPAGVFAGACEMGINLFPEFRGAEIRLIYAQVMRVLRHVLGVRYYFLAPYGMGVDNPDAIASGAFWFYRKMGFLAENPKIEELARQEEQRMRDYPGYRSDRRMLHRLKHTRAYFDLSGGECAPFDFAMLSRLQTARIAQRFGGDRAKAAGKSGDALATTLGAKGRNRWPEAERRAFDELAVAVSLIPGLKAWSRPEKTAAVLALRAKGAASEAGACKRWARHPKLVSGLRAVVGAG